MTEAIDHATLRRLVESGAVHAAQVYGQNGGWAISVHPERASAPAYVLSAARKGQPRLFRRMDTLVAYLADLGISHFEVDSKAYVPAKTARPDRSAALRQAHAAATHDKWFTEQVDHALQRADAPDTLWVDNAEAKEDWASLRDELLARGGN